MKYKLTDKATNHDPIVVVADTPLSVLLEWFFEGDLPVTGDPTWASTVSTLADLLESLGAITPAWDAVALELLGLEVEPIDPRAEAEAAVSDAFLAARTAREQANAAENALRRAVLEAVAAGLTKTSVASLAGVSRPTLDTWLVVAQVRANAAQLDKRRAAAAASPSQD